jgi:hypothetical protein
MCLHKETVTCLDRPSSICRSYCPNRRGSDGRLGECKGAHGWLSVWVAHFAERVPHLLGVYRALNDGCRSTVKMPPGKIHCVVQIANLCWQAQEWRLELAVTHPRDRCQCESMCLTARLLTPALASRTH